MKAVFGHNIIAFSATISALSKGQQVDKAWELFCNIEDCCEMLNMVTHDVIITALKKDL
jgi:pentatricopeptide repeat protein